MYRLNVSLNHDLITTVYGLLLKLTQILWYTRYTLRFFEKSSAKIRVSGVPVRCKTAGTKVVHPVHLGHSYNTHRQLSTTREVHITYVMIVVLYPDDSSWHTRFLERRTPLGVRSDIERSEIHEKTWALVHVLSLKTETGLLHPVPS